MLLLASSLSSSWYLQCEVLHELNASVLEEDSLQRITSPLYILADYFSAPAAAGFKPGERRWSHNTSYWSIPPNLSALLTSSILHCQLLVSTPSFCDLPLSLGVSKTHCIVWRNRSRIASVFQEIICSPPRRRKLGKELQKVKTLWRNWGARLELEVWCGKCTTLPKLWINVCEVSFPNNDIRSDDWGQTGMSLCALCARYSWICF